MSDLRTDFKDDVLNIITNEKRKYRMINNADGTVSFEDVTDYVQQGDTFGAAEVNQITEKVNSCLTRADVVDNAESTATDLPASANIVRELKEDLNDCFQSVSDGKTLVASAITGKGVATGATATFSQMATNISSIKTTVTPTAGNKNTKTAKLSTYGSTSATPSITLPANGTYIVTFVSCQGSKEGYEVNSSFAVGSFSVSGTSIVENAITAMYDSVDPSKTGTARLYSQSILVKTGSSAVTISRTVTIGGYGGNAIATIYAIKIG